MFVKIILLTCLLFSAIYPLCFWLSFRDPLKNNFHRFHLGISCFVLGLINFFLLASSIPAADKNLLILWTVFLFLVCGYSWKKPYPSPWLLTIPSLIGILVTLKILSTWIILNIFTVIISILGGMIFCASLFAMNLGHWYLNVHGLPIYHLQRATYVFWGLVALRAVLDVIFMFAQKVSINGELLTGVQFIFTMEGFLIVLGILFATLFPLITLYFVKGTLDVKSNQSATGILYAILCAVLIGDLTCKFYLLKYNIAL